MLDHPLVFIFIIFIGGLFAAKMLFVLSVAFVLPITKGALFVPTASSRIRTFLDAVPMKTGDLFVDIGCGDGRALRAARKRYQVRAVGYEVNPLVYAAARLLCLGRSGIRIRWGDFRTMNMSGADVVFCYLFPDALIDVARKLKAELKPNARVVSCNFPLPAWRPEQVLHPEQGLYRDPIYIYRIRQAGPGK